MHSHMYTHKTTFIRLSCVSDAPSIIKKYKQFKSHSLSVSQSATVVMLNIQIYLIESAKGFL